MTSTERELRLRLAAGYRVFAMLGWVEMIYNHITVRLPDSVTGGEKQFLINPFGLHYSEVTAWNLVKIDLEGKVIDGSPWPVNPAGFTVHAAIHDGIARRALRDAHPHHGRLAVAGLQGGLQMANFYSAQLHDIVAYHDFEGITDARRRGAAAAEAHRRPAGGDPAQPRPAGLGPDAAADLCHPLDVAARLRGPGGGLLDRAGDSSHRGDRAQVQRDALQFNPEHGGGQDVFDAMVRLVDRIDPGYRD